MARKYQPKQLQDWFRNKATSAAGYRKNIVGNTERLRNSIAIGKMYFFFYDAKHKDKLPVWDRFPLVFPIERYNDGFLGINLHYLSVNERKAIIDELTKFANNKNLTPNTKLKLSYDLLQSTKSLASLSRPCIKRYLTSQLRSRFVEITPDEWDKAVELPVEVFVRKP
jgi:hypothetical protein